MIKLKKLIKEHAWDRKFGEPLPTLKDVAEKHQIEEKTPMLTEKKELGGAIINKIAKLARNKNDQTIARIEFANRIPHKSLADTYNHIYQLEIKMGLTNWLKKVRDDADRDLVKIGKSMVSNFEDVLNIFRDESGSIFRNM